ncbi:hypothetical protein EDD18DRAFT_1107511 [Armillaria luteobubalina]|uniref:Uncharacterized protein n=1 Tax=Armillaria luteobubalina TaxID=153913 RepID=A0AA39Q383_9AGAR|nr:hypothetical protein EDD18DRAFT_1107511 [Armillaria luteobubalina]
MYFQDTERNTMDDYRDKADSLVVIIQGNQGWSLLINKKNQWEFFNQRNKTLHPRVQETISLKEAQTRLKNLEQIQCSLSTLGRSRRFNAGFTMLHEQLQQTTSAAAAVATSAVAVANAATAATTPATPHNPMAQPQVTPSRDRCHRPPEKNELAVSATPLDYISFLTKWVQKKVKVREDDVKRYEETWKSSAGTTPACGLDQFSHIMSNVYKYANDDYANHAIIENACLAHIRSMCSTYKVKLQPLTVQIQKQKDSNKASRKYSASISLIISEIKYKSNLLQLLAVAHSEEDHMMSSNEEVHQDLHMVYKICTPYWRSNSVTAWLRSLDYFHNQRHISNAAGASHSNTPRICITPHAEEEWVNKTAQYKCRLPRNTYNPTWLAAQPAGVVLLNIQPLLEQADMFVQDPTWHT